MNSKVKKILIGAVIAACLGGAVYFGTDKDKILVENIAQKYDASEIKAEYQPAVPQIPANIINFE